MKTSYLIIMSAVVGVLLGTAIGQARIHRWTLITDATQLDETKTPVDPELSGDDSDGDGRVEVDSESYDFGFLDINETGSHTFVITNVGTGPLRLRKGPTSCKCTSSLFEGGKDLAPGDSADIEVSWKVKDFAGPFSQTATVNTNDPNRRAVELKIKGTFTAPIDAKPRRITFSNVPVGMEQSASTQVLGFEDEPLEIKGFRLRAPERFRVEFSPIAVDDLEGEAESGVLATVTVLPGLPVGVFQDRLVLDTNYEKMPTVEIPIEGRVASDRTSIIGADWLADDGLLRIGHVDAGSSETRQLRIRSSNIPSDGLRLKVAEVDPKWLRVEIGETIATANNTGAITTVNITIPADAPVCSYLGSETNMPARIMIETNDTSAPMLQILVNFSVVR